MAIHLLESFAFWRHYDYNIATISTKRTDKGEIQQKKRLGSTKEQIYLPSAIYEYSNSRA